MIENPSHGTRGGSSTLPTRTRRQHAPMQRLGEALCRTADVLLLWQERRCQRRDLATLNDAMLKDIGVSRFDVSAECGKWPWQE